MGCSVGKVLGILRLSRFRYYFFDLIFFKYDINKIPKCSSFGMKCSKSRRFLGLRPSPRWGSSRRSPRPPSREGLLAFGNRSFAPVALAITPTWVVGTSASKPRLCLSYRLTLPPNLQAVATPLPVIVPLRPFSRCASRNKRSSSILIRDQCHHG